MVQPRLRVSTLIGLKYAFGQAVFEALAACEHVEIVQVIVPEDSLWHRYGRGLDGPEHGLTVPAIARYLSALAVVPIRTLIQSAAREYLNEGSPRSGNSLASRDARLPAGVTPVTVADANDPSVLSRVREANVDVLLIGAFPQILVPAWGEVAKRCSLNVHPSALPRQRGAQPLWWGIVDGESHKGVSLHRLTEGVDDGALLAQRTAPMAHDETGTTHIKWAIDTCKSVLDEGFGALREGRERWIEQDHANAIERRWPRDIHRKIDWDKDTTATILQRVRAGDFYLPLRPFFFIGERPIEVSNASSRPPRPYLTNKIDPPPGTVLSWSADWLDVRTLDGVVRLEGLTLFGWRVQCDALVLRVGQLAR